MRLRKRPHLANMKDYVLTPQLGDWMPVYAAHACSGSTLGARRRLTGGQKTGEHG